jgi:hypothetical protein
MDIRKFMSKPQSSTSSALDSISVDSAPPAKSRKTDAAVDIAERHDSESDHSESIDMAMDVGDCAREKSLDIEKVQIVSQGIEIEQTVVTVMSSSLPDAPYQPPTDNIPHQFAGKEKKNCLKFQKSWYQKYPWIHYDVKLNGVLCFTCLKAESLNVCNLVRKREDTFTKTGFRNWKKALEKFTEHDRCAAHRFAREQLVAGLRPGIDTQISKHISEQQARSRKALQAIFTSAKLLARQGLAFRGHDTDEGNFKQLLRVRSEDLTDLRNFLQTKNDMTSGVRQNEMLDLLSHSIVRKICSKVREAGAFSVIVDGTQDVSGKEQESICLRYVDESLNVIEAFIGMYDSSNSTTGQSIANCVFDVFTRLQLPLSQLRGQTFDGASNMSGIYNGCQAIISSRQPLALYTHCGSHCTNLVAEKVCASGQFVRNSIQIVQEIGATFSASIHCRTTFAKISESNETANIKKIKPLCPTRWLVRVPAIQDIIDQYENVLMTLEELAAKSISVSARANGLATQLRNGSTLLGFNMAVQVLRPLETLNKSLQSRNMTVAGMLEAVAVVIGELENSRSAEAFHILISSVNKMIADIDLEELRLPRQRKPPARLTVTGSAPPYHPSSIVEHYMPQFFMMIDTAISGLNERFSGSTGLHVYRQLETLLLCRNASELNTECVNTYPEINVEDLKIQLAMFHRKYNNKNVSEVTALFREMVPEVRQLFCQVEILLRILLVCPASSAEAERSFSGLRRLKTWLRSTMSQNRLNSVCVCHIHQDLLDAIDIDALMKDFVSRSDVRQSIFGKF